MFLFLHLLVTLFLFIHKQFYGRSRLIKTYYYNFLLKANFFAAFVNDERYLLY